MRVAVDAERCTLCGACVLTCPADMVREREGRIKIGRVMCLECGHCVAICPQDAVQVIEEPPGEGFVPARRPLLRPEALAELIRYRRTVRRYLPQSVPRRHLEQMLDAARWAPTAANCQCAQYLVITDPAVRDRITERVTEFYRRYAEAIRDPEQAPARLAELGLDPQFGLHPHMLAAVPAFVKNQQTGRDRLFFGAPAVIVIHADPQEVLPEAACGFATYLLALMAEALGLGTCITAYASEALRALPDLRAALGLPAPNQVHYVLAVGYPEERFRQVPPRRPAQVRWLQAEGSA